MGSCEFFSNPTGVESLLGLLKAGRKVEVAQLYPVFLRILRKLGNGAS